MNDLGFRPATPADAPALEALVNSAYRGDASCAGWTTEADLVTGARIGAGELVRLMEADGSLILLCLDGDAIIGSVHLKRLDDTTAYLGLFVVKPTLQGGGASASATSRRPRPRSPASGAAAA
jgi:hypothetical protein